MAEKAQSKKSVWDEVRSMSISEKPLERRPRIYGAVMQKGAVVMIDLIVRYDLIPYRGKSLMFWALEWFRMPNDTFYELYGFNFNPHSYHGLYEQARERVYGKGG